jgi:nucleotide-binding universal stress UspA family protein
MHKKILLAVDDTQPSKMAVRYAVQMSKSVSDLQFVLLNVQPMVSQFLKHDARTSAAARKQLENVQNKHVQFSQHLLEDYRREMESQGIHPDQIETRTQPRNLGYAKDIIDVAQEKNYDAIVVGRRGLSGIAKLYAGSVTTDILEQSQVIPVWLVDGTAPAGDLLLAVDGSEASLRVIDHVSFMLSGAANAAITMLHITNSVNNYCEIDPDESVAPELDKINRRGDRACIDQFYPHAIQKFEQAGLDAGRVHFEMVEGGRRIGKAIFDFARDRKLQTLVVGRRGLAKSFFMGSVSRHLINNLADGALWIVP